jgi:hypothetical protein
LDDPSAIYFQAQSNHIAAHRILDFGSRVGVGQTARMPRILKMIEKLRGVHLSIVPMRTLPDVVLRSAKCSEGPLDFNSQQGSPAIIPTVLGSRALRKRLSV